MQYYLPDLWPDANDDWSPWCFCDLWPGANVSSLVYDLLPRLAPYCWRVDNVCSLTCNLLPNVYSVTRDLLPELSPWPLTWCLCWLQASDLLPMLAPWPSAWCQCWLLDLRHGARVCSLTSDLVPMLAPAPSPRTTTCWTLSWSRMVTRFSPRHWNM
jgi:hypothetical protein